MNITKLSEQFGSYLYHRLPKVYRDYDVAIDRRVTLEDGKTLVKRFYTLEEYLRSFAEGGFQPLLEDIEAIISLIDPMNCPEEYLPMLLQHFGLDFIEDIPIKFQRRLVQNIVTLYRKKGTIPAVAFLARELSGFDVTIEESERGGVQIALVRLTAYSDEDAELLLAQETVQRYIHLFLPANTKAEVVVTYGFTEGVHVNSKLSLEDYKSKDFELVGMEFDHIRYDVDEDDIKHAGFIDELYSLETDFIKKCVEDDFWSIKSSYDMDDATLESYNFSPFDISSLTNMLDEGDFVFTNGSCCEDSIIEKSEGTDAVEFYPIENPSIDSIYVKTSEVTESCLGTNIEGEILKGDVVELVDDSSNTTYFFKSPTNLYGTSAHPISFVFDRYNKSVKVYYSIKEYVFDGSLPLTKVSGYNSFTVADNLIFTLSFNTHYRTSGAIFDSSARYGNNDGKTYINMNRANTWISNSTIESVEDMQEYLKRNPIVVRFIPLSHSYPYFEKYLQTESSETPKFTAHLEELSSYLNRERRLFSSNTGFIIEDYSSTKEVILPFTLYSMNGKSDFIEKREGKYFIHHWVEYFNDWEALEFSTDSIGFPRELIENMDCYHNWNNDYSIDEIAKHWYYSPLPLYNPDTNSIKDVDWGGVGHLYISSSKNSDAFMLKTESTNILGLSASHVHAQYYPLIKSGVIKSLNLREELSDIKPRLYYERKEQPRIEEITDKVLINKLNLLPISDNYVKIYSKDIPFSEIKASVKSKLYY